MLHAPPPPPPIVRVGPHAGRVIRVVRAAGGRYVIDHDHYRNKHKSLEANLKKDDAKARYY